MALALKKRTVTLVVVLVLAALSWWIQRQQQVTQVSKEEAAPLMDYSLTDFEMTAMDDQGIPKQRLRAESMLHYAEADYAELVKPHLEVYRHDAGTTLLDADKALVYQGGDSVFLEGDVRMQREAWQQQGAMEILTQDVWFDAQREYARTDAAVTINDTNGTTTGRGMQADIKAGSMQLLSSVRGKYVQE
jgi:lipopolysaccharide export system protein LptC